MARIRRKKKRTHRVEHVDPSKKGVPKSFVFRMGKHRSLVKDLEADFKQVMLPNTAANLKVSKANVLKDFVHVAGPVGVSHFVIFTATENASYMKICKSPRGPTLMLKVKEYALIRDVQAALARPRMPASAFKHAPLVVLNGFGQEDHMKLTAVMFQNMFPAINVTQAKLTDCQRVVLLTYNKELATISFRHYSISVTPSGLSKGVKSLVQRKNLPDLSQFTDVADFIERSGYGSESDGEDAAASRVTLSQTLGRGNLAQRTSRIKLHEIGPRLELEVVKVQEGLAEGRVLHHRYVNRSVEEVAQKELEIEEEARLKAERRRVQEENVRKKAKDVARTAPVVEKKRKRDEDGGKQPQGKQKRKAGEKKPWWEEDTGARHERDDDAAYYREEVGDEPDETFGGLTDGGATVHRGGSRGRGRGGRDRSSSAASGRLGGRAPAGDSFRGASSGRGRSSVRGGLSGRSPSRGASGGAFRGKGRSSGGAGSGDRGSRSGRGGRSRSAGRSSR